MTKKFSNYFVLLSTIVFMITISSILILNNVGLLFIIAGGLNKPSKSYYFVMERIYKLSKNNEVLEDILHDLNNDKNTHLNNIYIDTLGIIGNPTSATVLMKKYVKLQGDPNYADTLSSIIDSLGLIGNNDVVPILERLNKNYEKHRMQITKYSIVRALYLIAGKAYEFTNNSGENAKLKITEGLKEARRIILETKGRDRTFKEMRSLDKLYRPPGW
jgi:hypothetical protein